MFALCQPVYGQIAAPTTIFDSGLADMENLDLSNFDANAILRGAQLTLVGGTFSLAWYCSLPRQRHADMCSQ